MTPKKTSTGNTSQGQGIINKTFVWLAGVGFLGLFGFLWNLNQTLAVMQSNDKYREERVKDIDRNVSTLVNEMRTMKDSDIQDIKDRLKTLEVQNEKK